MIALFFAVFAASLFIVRLAKSEQNGLKWTTILFLSGVLMFIAYYFWSVGVPYNVIHTTGIYGGSPVNTTTTTSDSFVAVGSQGSILLLATTICYMAIVFLWGLRELLAMKKKR